MVYLSEAGHRPFIVGGLLKLPEVANNVNYVVSVSFFGVLSGGTNSDRVFSVDLVPSGEPILLSQNVVKARSNDLLGRNATFNTYTTGLSDKFITDGISLIVVNTYTGSVDINATKIKLAVLGNY